MSYEECRADTLAIFSSRLLQLPKKRVGDVTLSELCSFSEYPNGLYFFFDEENHLWYVGKSTSRSFIERVPSHFDTREDAWFNTLPKKIMDVCSIGEYVDAHSLGLSLHLVLLGVKEKQTAINLEGALRDYLQPELNKAKKQKAIGTTVLASYEA
ncbi:hypothetical protein [Nitrosomonas eutropha]|uniref:hypothetical protein n=1 Tax=Nitrosomonas eutropha TaxID=916 RepID=UPI001C4311F1|nr:hypothetical protein [Nitrosomonas eutropha]